MEENIKFQSEVCYDLATYKDFSRINTYTITRVTICGLVYVACMVYLLCTMAYSFSAKSVLILSLFTIGICVYQWYRNRDGGIQYKRMLRDNKDEVPHYQITVEEGGITIKNLSTGNERSGSFANIRQILESNRLLILVDDLKIAYTIDKTTLTGGSREELVRFLLAHCPNMKKRVRKGRFGCVIQFLIRTLPILMLLLSLAVLFHIPEKLRGQFTNDTPSRQMVEELAQLDIHISDRALATILLWESDCVSLFPKYPGASKVYDLLCVEGMGQYDYETMEWTPSTSGVYWFDLEVMYVDRIYTDFLTGLDAMDEALTFTNVMEDYSRADPESGLGMVTVSFDYLGQGYTLNARYNYDWFDTEILYELGKILSSDQDPKNLWYTTDGQGVLLYYGTKENADALQRKTGLYFLDPVANYFTMGMG